MGRSVYCLYYLLQRHVNLHLSQNNVKIINHHLRQAAVCVFVLTHSADAFELGFVVYGVRRLPDSPLSSLVTSLVCTTFLSWKVAWLVMRIKGVCTS